MKPFSILISTAIALCGCVTQDDLYSSEPRVRFRLDDNYQAAYARLLRTMKVCIRPGFTLIPGSSTMTVDGQLFPELGYGEITSGLQGMVPVYYYHIRLTKDGSGTDVSVAVANLPAGGAQRDAEQIAAWARGSTDCGRWHVPF